MKVESATSPHPKVRRLPMEHPRHQYPEETKALQKIARDCGLVERIKWGKPCFTLDDRNIVLIQRFNKYIALLFFKGVLLQDPEKLLVRISHNIDVPRQLRFTRVEEIAGLTPTIAAYIKEAVEVERSGARTKPRTAKQLVLPGELQTKLEGNPVLKSAFATLTPGRQKGYILHIAGAKQSNTRASRVEKIMSKVLAGKGLHE